MVEPILIAPFRLFIARSQTSVAGKMTLMDVKTQLPVPGLEKLAIASGQRGFHSKEWVRGKSPIPYSDSVVGGAMWLMLKNPKQTGQLRAPGKAIGEFWPISSMVGDVRKTVKYDYSAVRWDIGLHPENDFYGSLGCTVVQKHEPFTLLSYTFHELAKAYDVIEVQVVRGKF